MFLRKIKKEVDKISKISLTHPVYATYMSENLLEMFTAQDIRIEHFKRLPRRDIDWAEQIIESVENLHNQLIENLG